VVGEALRPMSGDRDQVAGAI